MWEIGNNFVRHALRSNKAQSRSHRAGLTRNSMSKPEFSKRTPPGVKPVQRQGQSIAPTGVRAVQRDRLSWHQFAAEPARYEAMAFRNCGRSGLKLSAISLGAWETFGGYVGPELARGCIFRAFNLGITHFDLANYLRHATRPRGNHRRPHAARNAARRNRCGHESRTSHVAGAVWRRRVAQSPSDKYRAIAQAARTRLRGYFLFAPARPDARLWRKRCARSIKSCGRVKRFISV